MKIAHIIFSSSVATGLMTLYSYWHSHHFNKQFKEPQLLTKLLSTKGRGLDLKTNSTRKGWAAHLVTGILFTFSYWKMWEKHKIKPGMWHGLVIGAVTGVFGGGIWKITFDMHPNPPKRDFKSFYRHLIVAHIIFGLSNVKVYRLLKRDKS